MFLRLPLFRQPAKSFTWMVFGLYFFCFPKLGICQDKPLELSSLFSLCEGLKKGGVPLGSYVNYKIHDKKGAQVTTILLQMAFIGRVKEGYWIEISTVPARGQKIVIKYRLSRCDQKQGERIDRFIIKIGGLKPFEFTPPKSFNSNQLNIPDSLKRVKIEYKGTEQLIVSRKSLPCKVYEDMSALVRLHVSEKVPLWNLVKLSSKIFTITLVSFGQGAKSEIDEKEISPLILKK